MYAIDFNRDIDIDIEFAELVEPVAVRAPKPRCADGHGTLTHLFFSDIPLDIARAKAIYVFNSRMFFRVIGQYIETTRDPLLWTFPVLAKESEFSGSALFAYKLNWQTVLYVGYGDNRSLFEGSTTYLQPQNRQFLFKVSYAFQR